ncbi:MAG: hypothetical protein WBN24_11670 [Acidimicrobiia bacterium]
MLAGSSNGQALYVINELGENDGGLGAADFSFVFGNPGDQPVVGDWDGDGVDEIGLHRESSGLFYWRNTRPATVGRWVQPFSRASVLRIGLRLTFEHRNNDEHESHWVPTPASRTLQDSSIVLQPSAE